MAQELNGKILREYRLRKGLTQSELEQKSGVSLKTIKRIETASKRAVQKVTAERLARALETDPKDLARERSRVIDMDIVLCVDDDANRPEEIEAAFMSQIMPLVRAKLGVRSENS